MNDTSQLTNRHACRARSLTCWSTHVVNACGRWAPFETQFHATSEVNRRKGHRSSAMQRGVPRSADDDEAAGSAFAPARTSRTSISVEPQLRTAFKAFLGDSAPNSARNSRECDPARPEYVGARGGFGMKEGRRNCPARLSGAADEGVLPALTIPRIYALSTPPLQFSSLSPCNWLWELFSHSVLANCGAAVAKKKHAPERARVNQCMRGGMAGRIGRSQGGTMRTEACGANPCSIRQLRRSSSDACRHTSA